MPENAPESTIPVARPWLGEAEAEAARRAILSGWVTQGPEVAAFEREFAAYVGAEHACAVANCTAALRLALHAAGVGPGDEVITVSHSFIATASSVRHCGATPAFVDVEPATGNIDPERVEAAINRRTRAILCVHQLGMPCDLRALVEIGHRRRLPLIEDAACAIGSEVRWGDAWERIGRPHGDAACFSFHPRKVITTGDGGMITTNRRDWDEKFRLWRQHGMSISDAVRHSAREVTFESYPTIGSNERLTDIQAAVGREQLRRLPAILEGRRRGAAHYRTLLAGIPGLGLPEEPAWARSNWQSYCVRLPDGLDQRRVMQAMLDGGVATRRGVMCAHREPAYAREPWSCGVAPGDCACPPSSCARLAEGERLQDRGLILPLYHPMGNEEREAVATALRRACAGATSTPVGGGLTRHA